MGPSFKTRLRRVTDRFEVTRKEEYPAQWHDHRGHTPLENFPKFARPFAQVMHHSNLQAVFFGGPDSATGVSVRVWRPLAT